MRNTLPLFLGVLALVLVAGCTQPQPKPGEPGGMCGGIGGIQCGAGHACEVKDAHPDAAGTCVKAKAPANFVECAAAGYPVMESYPRQCRGSDGRTFTEAIGEQPAGEGERCGGFDGRLCEPGLICETSAGPPGSSDLDTGTCVKSPHAPGAEGCTLMRNVKTGEIACFGCGKTTCIDPIPDFQPYERDPDQPGIPYSCYIDEEGGCALAQ